MLNSDGDLDLNENIIADDGSEPDRMSLFIPDLDDNANDKKNLSPIVKEDSLSPSKSINL